MTELFTQEIDDENNNPKKITITTEHLEAIRWWVQESREIPEPMYEMFGSIGEVAQNLVQENLNTLFPSGHKWDEYADFSIDCIDPWSYDIIGESYKGGGQYEYHKETIDPLFFYNPEKYLENKKEKERLKSLQRIEAEKAKHGLNVELEKKRRKAEYEKLKKEFA